MQTPPQSAPELGQRTGPDLRESDL